MTTASQQFYTLSDLKQRGWNDALIARFLGKPDELRDNPHYRSAPNMKLYKVERVEQAEHSSEFREGQESRKGRREAAQRALATKRKKLDEYVEALEIDVQPLSKEELVRAAVSDYNAGDRGNELASEYSDPEFLARICVNYLRHCETEYEEHLSEIAGKVGTHDAYLKIKTKVLDAIADAYPWLAKECSQQEQRMWQQEMESL